MKDDLTSSDMFRLSCMEDAAFLQSSFEFGKFCRREGYSQQANPFRYTKKSGELAKAEAWLCGWTVENASQPT